MAKQIWLPKAETHVVVNPEGEIKIWDSMIMIREELNKSNFGFEKEKDKE